MLSREENELLTQVGPGTPCGELMRRYWHPVATSWDLHKNPVRSVTILGESLVLYRDRSGQVGLIDERCPHRRTTMTLGIPEERGLRCPYHGWLFSEQGSCLEQPLEPEDSTFNERVSTKAYPAQELGGLVWAYLGPEPAPLLPRWDLLVREDVFRQILVTELPCNWLQVMENRADLAHATYLHGRFFQYILERQGRATDDPKHRSNASMRNPPVKHGVNHYEYGLLKRVLRKGQSEDAASWQQGVNPIVFPYTLRNGGTQTIRQSFQIGVPIDDTRTWHVSYHCYMPEPGVEIPLQDVVPSADVPLRDANGELILDYVLAQDFAAWWGQGDIVDRSQERLGQTDVVVIAYRRFLQEQIEKVQRGEEPINVFRDPSRNVCLEFPLLPEGAGTGSKVSSYRQSYHEGYAMDDVDRYCPDIEVIKDLMRRSEELARTREAEQAASLVDSA